MKINIHRSNERGHSNHGWLDSHFSFSFADYFNRNRMGCGVLRVLNDDVIAPSTGFPMHPHDNMEIVTIVTEGAVEHKDSMGNGTVIRPGEAQRMSAGTGVMHSEWNPSDTEILRLFQIWIKTRDRGIRPEYEQSVFDLEAKRGSFVTLASGEPDDGGLTFHQDAWIKRGLFSAGDVVEYVPKTSDNAVFLFVIEGEARVGEINIERRDDVELFNAKTITINVKKGSDLLLIEVPAE